MKAGPASYRGDEMQIKVCGVTNNEDAAVAAEAGADFVGVIRAPSKRRVTAELARQLAAGLPAGVDAVFVYQDARLDEIVDELGRTGGSWVQLHGSEPVSYLAELRQRCPAVSVIRAWAVHDTEAGAELLEYLTAAQAAAATPAIVLLDAPKGGPHPGYDVLRAVGRQVAGGPWRLFLAGGLTPDNIDSAIGDGPFDGVDVASGVERAPGVKDHDRLRAFIAAVRRR